MARRRNDTTLPPRVAPLVSLPPITGKLTKYGKHLWYLAAQEAVGLIWQAFVTGSTINPTQSDIADPAASVWTRWKFEYTDIVSNDAADTLMFKVDVANDTNGVLDSTWTETDLDQVETVFVNLVTALATHVASRYRCARISAYRMAFMPLGNVDEDGKPGPAFAVSGGPIRVATPNATGTFSTVVPGQIRSTVTFRTPSRPHWGRSYLPTPALPSYASSGRLTTAYATAIASLWDDTVSALDANNFYIVIPTTQSDKHSVRTLQNVTAVACDDVPDVQRRGRPHTPLFHSIIPAPAADEATAQPADSAAAA